MSSGPRQGTEPWLKGTEVVAQYNFHGKTGDDLPFKKKDVLEIVKSTRDPNWYHAKKPDGTTGMIPANYVMKRGEVKLHAMPWFHGNIERKDAENLLKPPEDGLFLVRESTNYQGDYTLCVCCNKQVENYRIIYRNNKLTIDEEEYFDSLTYLVEHYMDEADGLCTKLIKPVPKLGNLDYSVDRKAFVDQGWVINLADIKEKEELGKGEFADVVRAEYQGKEVAIKKLKDNNRAAQTFLAEASVMTQLSHTNLVQLLGVVLEENIFIVTEFLSKGSLVDYLRSRGRSIITKSDQINFATHTCCGMAYLEEKKLVHRDLAARNVLISKDNVAKVADFGLARHVDSNQAVGKLPIKWTAPEAIRKSKFTNKSDIWSFGVLLWEIYSFGRIPYPRIPLSEVVMHVEKGYRMESPDGCAKEIYSIMKEAWSDSPEKRPTFSQVKLKLIEIQNST